MVIFIDYVITYHQIFFCQNSKDKPFFYLYTKFEAQPISTRGGISLRSWGGPCSLCTEYGWLPCMFFWRVLLAGITPAVHSQQHQFLGSSFSFLEMSRAQNIARALNSFARDGFDMMGGADGAALAELLGEYLAAPGSDAQPTDSKGPPHHEYSLIIN